MRIQQHKMSLPPFQPPPLPSSSTGCKGWAKFLDTARRYSKLFGEVGAKTGMSGEWSKTDARRANAPPRTQTRTSRYNSLSLAPAVLWTSGASDGWFPPGDCARGEGVAQASSRGNLKATCHSTVVIPTQPLWHRYKPVTEGCRRASTLCIFQFALTRPAPAQPCPERGHKPIGYRRLWWASAVFVFVPVISDKTEYERDTRHHPSLKLGWPRLNSIGHGLV